MAETYKEFMARLDKEAKDDLAKEKARRAAIREAREKEESRKKKQEKDEAKAKSGLIQLGEEGH